MKQELLRLSADQFVALILDNEVTVGEFVTTPPLSWTRLIQRNGIFQIAEGYPTNLTAAQAKFEMRNWDEVSLPAIMRGLEELDDSADYVLFGNNAGQGLPLAQSLLSGLGPQSRGDYLREQPAGKERIRKARLPNLLSQE